MFKIELPIIKTHYPRSMENILLCPTMHMKVYTHTHNVKHALMCIKTEQEPRPGSSVG